MSPTPPAPAERLADRYELIERIGAGTFGETWRARDPVRDRVVAVKILDHRRADWKGRELFEREAAVLATLRHHGIPEVYEAFRAPWNGVECTCLAMEYIEGTPLETVITERRPFDAAEAVSLFVGLLGILDYLHRRVPPVVHRDLKPSNVIVRPDKLVALVDFGSVREGFAGTSNAGSTVAGTYGYMPYEQYMGQASPSSDLYALGATMLHLLTGRPPRDFLTDAGLIEVPETLAGGANLRAAIARMLMHSPADRFASAAEVQRALIGAPATAAVGPAAASYGPRAVPAARRTVPPIQLPATPRAITGATKEQFDRVAYGMWTMMTAGEKSSGRPSLVDVGVLGFFSLITAGILPLIFWGMARSRRRRTAMFFRHGLQAQGTVLDIAMEKPAFEVPIARVHYEFELDGLLHRDADTVLPTIAHRWRIGDTIQLLVLPEQDYDSIIVSAG